MWIVSVALVVLALTLFVLLYRKRCTQIRLLKDLGISGPEPHWLYGNLKELRGGGKQPHQVLQEWTKQYGKIYGYYEGPEPVVVTSDLDVIKQVFVKNFSSFHARKSFPLQPPNNTDQAHVLLAYGRKWKRLRSIINPTFSSAKLKQMFSEIDSKGDILITKLAEAASDHGDGKSFNIIEYYQRLTLHVIGETAFGINVDTQNNPDDPFLDACRHTFDNLDPSKERFIFKIAALFPEIRVTLWKIFRKLLDSGLLHFPGVFIIKNMEPVIAARRKLESKFKKVDLLQLMLDAEVKTTEDISTSNHGNYSMKTDDNKPTSSPADSNKAMETSDATNIDFRLEKFEKKLNNEEIKSQSFVFLIAGYETTSSALSYTTYLLAMHPDKQCILTAEVDEYFPNRSELTYDAVQKMPYLQSVLQETLRMYPLASGVINRCCMEPCTVGGLHIPVGVNIQPDVWSIHYDTEIWGQDAQEFKPERFTEESLSNLHPMAWIPFGVGPRNCVGLRFALMEAKIVLIKVLQNFVIEKCDDTHPLDLKERGVIQPDNGINIKLINRRQI